MPEITAPLQEMDKLVRATLTRYSEEQAGNIMKLSALVRQSSHEELSPDTVIQHNLK